MLADLAHNLCSTGTRLLVARDVGQVRDVLRRVDVPEIVVGVYPTVDAGRTPTATTRWRMDAMRSETQRGPRRPVDDPPLPAKEARRSISAGQQLINPLLRQVE